MVNVTVHELTFVLDRPPTGEEQAALYEAGLSDSAIEVDNGTGYLHVDREALTMDEAVSSVIADARRAGFDAQLVDGV